MIIRAHDDLALKNRAANNEQELTDTELNEEYVGVREDIRYGIAYMVSKRPGRNYLVFRKIYCGGDDCKN